MNNVVLGLTTEPKDILFINLLRFTFIPYFAKSFNRFCDLLLPLPNVKKKNPSGVNSVINLSSANIYLPDLIPGLSAGIDGSISNISDSAKAFTSYHLLFLAFINCYFFFKYLGNPINNYFPFCYCIILYNSSAVKIWYFCSVWCPF